MEGILDKVAKMRRPTFNNSAHTKSDTENFNSIRVEFMLKEMTPQDQVAYFRKAKDTMYEAAKESILKSKFYTRRNLTARNLVLKDISQIKGFVFVDFDVKK